uniref:DUF4371 domain-containing protein n=1 Tax=Trichuris muris TaxID=70415 RepID=A0A5S6Q3Q7_TRIMR
MTEAKKKCRQYSVEYLRYGFIPSPSNVHMPLCLICEKVFSNESMKPSRLLDHLKKMHADKACKDLSYFQSLRDQFRKRTKLSCIFSSISQQDKDGLRASYKISLLIAKSGNPHTIGEELILPAVSEVLRTVLHKPAAEIIRKLPLSNSTVQRRLDEMAADVEDQLCNFLRTTKFSLQLDEAVLPRNEALLLAYVRFIKEEKINQELLFARQLETDTKGQSIFLVVEEFFREKRIPLANIMAVATDGAPSMVGRHRGFVAHLKRSVSELLVVHCVIHRQQLVAKHLSDRLHRSLGFVITAVNKIRSSPLNDRLFAQLCEKNDDEFCRLLLHTEVRWLSRGACLSRFYALFDTVLQFFEKDDTGLSNSLKKFKVDIAYLSDLCYKFNEMNLQLQGDDLNLIKTKSVISAFVMKLLLFKENLGRGQFSQFPNLSQLRKNAEVSDDDVGVYCEHLAMLHKDMCERYEDILALEVPQWVLDPFSDVGETETHLQEEFIELQTNEEVKTRYKNGYHDFWLQREISIRYPQLWEIVKKLLVPFPSSYLVERGFSVVLDLFTKKRNRLEIVQRGDLRLLLTNIEPDVEKLLASHQPHPSH